MTCSVKDSLVVVPSGIKLIWWHTSSWARWYAISDIVIDRDHFSVDSKFKLIRIAFDLLCKYWKRSSGNSEPYLDTTGRRFRSLVIVKRLRTILSYYHFDEVGRHICSGVWVGAYSIHMQSNWACSLGHASLAQKVECWSLHLVGGVATTTRVSGLNPEEAGVSHLNLTSICGAVWSNFSQDLEQVEQTFWAAWG